jgi:outer membrane protein OmpA-like peptidoglycan-associated protein
MIKTENTNSKPVHLFLAILIGIIVIGGCASQRGDWASEEKFFIPLDTIPQRAVHQAVVKDCSEEIAMKIVVIDSLKKENESLHKSLANLQDILIERSLKLEKGKSVILKGVNFAKGKATLTKESEATLEQAFISLVLNPDFRLEIAGYTDNTGDQAKNDQLSLERANTVREWLVNRGIDPGRLLTVGKGPREPVASNDTPEGRAANRRIEFHVLD